MKVREISKTFLFPFQKYSKFDKHVYYTYNVRTRDRKTFRRETPDEYNRVSGTAGARSRGDRVFRFNTYVTEKGTVGSSPWNFNQRQLLVGVARPPYAALSLGGAAVEFNFPALTNHPPERPQNPPSSFFFLSCNNPQLRVFTLLPQEDSLTTALATDCGP